MDINYEQWEVISEILPRHRSGLPHVIPNCFHCTMGALQWTMTIRTGMNFASNLGSM
ncbi:MAG: hypothetical protein KA713_08175 [Chryseotalea sp. WA131a]|nr:MAG: hypothetical protein KA713_08175 [Chryseotalea sp. WA131a]